MLKKVVIPSSASNTKTTVQQQCNNETQSISANINISGVDESKKSSTRDRPFLRYL